MPNDKTKRGSSTRTSSGKKAGIKDSSKKAAKSRVPPGTAVTPSTALKPAVDIGSIIERLEPPVATEFRVHVRRPADLAVFDLILQNLKLAAGPKLIRVDAARPAYLIVELPPQSFGEEAFLDATGPEVPAPPSAPPNPPFKETGATAKNLGTPGDPLPPMPAARIRMAGRSRLAFTMPADVAELSFTLDAVMKAVRLWPLRLDAIAAPEPDIRLTPGRFEGKEWLKAVTVSSGWTSTLEVLSTALQSQVGAGIAKAVAEAGARIADRAAAALVSAPNPDLAGVLNQMMTAEMKALSTKYPKLLEGQARDIAIATLSMKATESLSASKVSFGTDLSFVPFVPFLPVIISPHKPSNNVTALELPYRVVVSPIESARLLHRDQPVTDAHSGRTELWHTRVTTAPRDYGPDGPSKFRAIWSPDYPIDDFSGLLAPPKPFRMSLDPLDRQMLVKLMAGYNEITVTHASFTPKPSVAHRLMLSALGGLLDSEGNWSVRPVGVGLEQWRHLATLGRDHYVRVVYAGFLMPFGHSASLIKVTERKFESVNGNLNTRAAVLRQRFFIIVREHVKSYPSAGHAAGWFNFPFTQVEILTRVTPSLRAPDLAECRVIELPGKPIYTATIPPRAAFWPMLTSNVTTGNFRFEIAATDLCGKRSTFPMPLLFIGEEANQAVAANVVAGYNAADEASRRLAPLAGASVCFAPVQAGSEGDPRLPTGTITYEAVPAGGGPTAPHFNPQLRFAEVGIRQIQRLLGQNQAVVKVEYPDVYKASGFGGSNAGEIFLKLTAPHELNFGGGADQAKSDALGALASPAMAIQGLSRIMGPVSAKPPTGGQTVENALQNVIGNKFDPTDFFKGAKILGGIDLSTILNVVNSLAGGDVPKMVSRELPDKIEASFHWQTQITKSDPAGLLVHTAGGQATILSMDGHVSAPIANPQGSTFEAQAQITNFKVNLFGFIIIWFDALSFKASRGKKPDVAVDMHPGDESIVFGGALEFVNEIRKFIPSNGFSDPPNISVTPSGISAGYSLGLPNIAVGILSLTNISIGAGFSLPFDSEPVEVKFNFCERQHPFTLMVSFLGGGGFFAIGIGTEGVREIEAALEFGAGVAIDLGVASGSVEIKAGVYFHWLQSGSTGTIELTGYVRLHGELSVLGLISASLTFNLQLSYLKEGSKSTVWGEATLTIEVEVLFFSASVSVKCRREFGGSPSDPTFIQLIPAQPVWAEYCAAFAAE